MVCCLSIVGVCDGVLRAASSAGGIGHELSVTSLAPLSDRRLCSASSDTRVKLWSLASTVPQLLTQWVAHSGAVNAIAAHAEQDHWLLSAGVDRVAKVRPY
jgi:WD40 repeat protein